MEVRGEIKFCSCQRMKPVRGDVDMCEACYAVKRYQAERSKEEDRTRIG